MNQDTDPLAFLEPPRPINPTFSTIPTADGFEFDGRVFYDLFRFGTGEWYAYNGNEDRLAPFYGSKELEQAYQKSLNP